MILDLNPEFGYEVVCAAPYAYWLKQQGEYVKVTTCKGMTPFYWFCDEVIEKHTTRSMDNRTNGVEKLPNGWIHHNATALFGKDYSDLTEEEKAQANGVLDYSEWTPPPYAKKYYKKGVPNLENYIVISNRYNLEHGESPVGYFDIECLYKLFSTLTEKGYNVIYRRPKNTEFITDSNELQNVSIEAEVEGIGRLTDYELVSYFDNVYLLDDLIEEIGTSYNEAQLNVYANAEGFIAMGGGCSVLCSYFGKPVIIYVNTSNDIRPGYFKEEAYFNKLSSAKIIPIVDKKTDIIKRGYRDYSNVFSSVEDSFRGAKKQNR